MYEKLGDLLKEALDNPESIDSRIKSGNDTIDNTPRHSESMEESRNTHRVKFIFFHDKIPTGQVIKEKDYKEKPKVPQEVVNALYTLQVTAPVTWLKIKSQYRKLLKETHPDTGNVQQNISIDKIKEAFEVIKKFYGK